MKIKVILFTFLLLYTISFNNSIQIFAQDENSSENMDMSLEKYDPDSVEPAHLDENGQPVVVAKAAVLMDADTGVVIWGKNENELHYPASITKVLTALIACEETEPTDLVTFSEEAVYGIGEDSSSIAVRVGETLNMEQCLYAILLASANDVCVGVSEYISGSQDAFVEKMNEKAKALGAKNSHFANSHGYHDENHYTTPYDMALILREALKNPKFSKPFGTLTYDIPETNIVDEVRHLNHRSLLLRDTSPYYYQYCKGSKTGFTDQAGNTLISYAEKDGIRLICCVMADRGFNTYMDTSLLFDYGFAGYSRKTLVKSGDLSLVLPVYQEYKDKTIDLGIVTAEVKEEFSAFLPNVINENTITIDYDVPESIVGGVKEGDVIGTANILYGENLIASMDLKANATIDPIPEEELIRQERMEMLMRLSFYAAGVLFIVLLVIILYRIFGNPKLRRHNKKYKEQRKYYRERRKLAKIKESTKSKENIKTEEIIINEENAED